MGPWLSGALVVLARKKGIICIDDVLRQKEHGAKKAIYLPKGYEDFPIVLPDDVGTSGSTVIAKANAIRQAYGELGMNCPEIVAVLGIIREPDGFALNMKKYEIQHVGLTSLDGTLMALSDSFTNYQISAILDDRKHNSELVASFNKN